MTSTRKTSIEQPELPREESIARSFILILTKKLMVRIFRKMLVKLIHLELELNFCRNHRFIFFHQVLKPGFTIVEENLIESFLTWIVA